MYVEINYGFPAKCSLKEKKSRSNGVASEEKKLISQIGNFL
jgi:hypothetical protein